MSPACWHMHKPNDILNNNKKKLHSHACFLLTSKSVLPFSSFLWKFFSGCAIFIRVHFLIQFESNLLWTCEVLLKQFKIYSTWFFFFFHFITGFSSSDGFPFNLWACLLGHGLKSLFITAHVKFTCTIIVNLQIYLIEPVNSHFSTVQPDSSKLTLMHK